MERGERAGREGHEKKKGESTPDRKYRIDISKGKLMGYNAVKWRMPVEGVKVGSAVSQYRTEQSSTPAK